LGLSAQIWVGLIRLERKEAFFLKADPRTVRVTFAPPPNPKLPDRQEARAAEISLRGKRALTHAAGRMPSSVAFQARKPAAISKRGIRSICTAGNCGDRNGAMIRATLDKNGQHFSHVEDCIASAADLDLVLRSAKTCKARLDR